MKRFIYFFSILVLITSCTDSYINENIESQEEISNNSPNTITIRSGAGDSILNVAGRKKSRTKATDFIRETIWTNGKGKTMYYEADEFLITKNMEPYIYPGSILSGKEFELGKYKFLPTPVEPIYISTSLPANNVTAKIERPSKTAIRQAARNFLINNGIKGRESLSFSYNMSSYSYYEQLKVAFSSNINVASVFNLSVDYNKEKIKSRTGVLVRFEQQYYDITMDFPEDGSILKNNSDISKIRAEKPFYINSVTYGRIGIMSIESSYSYEEVTLSVKAAFTAKVVNGSLDLSITQKEILSKAIVKIYIIGGENSYKTVDGFEAFQKFIIEKGIYTPDAPGVPIYFTGVMVEDNYGYYSPFKIDINY